MAHSFVQSTATEGQTTFPFAFTNGYLSEAHVFVSVDGADVPRTIVGGTVEIAPCTAGQEVIVYRNSPDTPVVTFHDGSILNKQNIDRQTLHTIMLAEEKSEQSNIFALSDIDMNYNKIIHLAPGVDPYDVVNKGQFDGFLEQTEDDRAAAEAAAANAQAAAGAAGQSATSAAEDAALVEELVVGFDERVETATEAIIYEGANQIGLVRAEGETQKNRAKAEADRAQGYAEILERPYEDMGAHTIMQGYPPVPSFSSMWVIVDGGIDPIDGVTVWNVGDVLLYSVQTEMWTRLSGSVLGGGGDPVPIEILDDLIMQQGKKIRFKIDEFVDTEVLVLDGDGDIIVGELPATPSTPVPAVKLGLAATELHHIKGTDAAGVAVVADILTSDTGLLLTGGELTGPLDVKTASDAKGFRLTGNVDQASLQPIAADGTYPAGVELKWLGGSDWRIGDNQIARTARRILQRPEGAVAGTWYPVLFNVQDQGASIVIDTASGSGTIPMNNNQFAGYVHSGGWADSGQVFHGAFHQYAMEERSIYAVHDGAESTGLIAFYVHEAAFPVVVQYDSTEQRDTPKTGLSVSYGTSTFIGTTTPGTAAGTNTRVMIDLGLGSGVYSNISGKLLGSRGDQQISNGMLISRDTSDLMRAELGITSRMPRVDFYNGPGTLVGRLQWNDANGFMSLGHESGGSYMQMYPDHTYYNKEVRTGTPQSGSANALARKDYVDGQIAGRAAASHTHTASQGNYDVVAGSYAAIGAYAQGLWGGGGGNRSVGAHLSGASLNYSTAEGNLTGGNMPGTWMLQGALVGEDDYGNWNTSVFIRIA